MAPKIGRNEPCPCGSGKKFKKCYGRASPVPDFSLPEDQRTGTPIDEYFALMPFLGLHMQKIIQFEKDGAELKKARNQYERRYHPGKNDGILDSHYVSWLYFDLRFGANRKTIVERVMDDPIMAKLVEPGPTCLRYMAASYATFYQVIDPGPDVVVLDALGTGRRWNVLYYRKMFDLAPEKGEVWYTRLLGPPERALSYTTPYLWEPETRAQFERTVRRITNDFLKDKRSIGVPADRLFAESQKESAVFWADYILYSNSAAREMLSSVPSEWSDLGLPHIVNNDREDFVFTEMHFRVKDEKLARRKLAALKSSNTTRRGTPGLGSKPRAAGFPMSRGPCSGPSASRRADSSPRRIPGSGPCGSNTNSWDTCAASCAWRKRSIASRMSSPEFRRRRARRPGRRAKSSTPAPRSGRRSASITKSTILRNGRGRRSRCSGT